MTNSVIKSSTKVVEGSRVPAAGLRDSLPNYHALVAITGSRQGSEEVIEEIAPLTAMVELVRTTIRGRRGLVVTKSMQEGLCEIIVWHAKRCGPSVRAVDVIYEPTEDPLKNIKSGETVHRMNTKERRLIAKIQAGITVPRSLSSSIANSTMPSGSPSTEFPERVESELSRRYCILCSSCTATRGVVRSLSVTSVSLVVARRPMLVQKS